MAVKLVVLYSHPDDPDAFDRHYFDIHMPMVRQLPGLLRAETGRLVNALDGGAQSFYRVAELYFPDEAAMDAGLASDAWKATAADFHQLAPPGSRMFVEILDGHPSAGQWAKAAAQASCTASSATSRSPTWAVTAATAAHQWLRKTSSNCTVSGEPPP